MTQNKFINTHTHTHTYTSTQPISLTTLPLANEAQQNQNSCTRLELWVESWSFTDMDILVHWLYKMWRKNQTTSGTTAFFTLYQMWHLHFILNRATLQELCICVVCWTDEQKRKSHQEHFFQPFSYQLKPRKYYRAETNYRTEYESNPN